MYNIRLVSIATTCLLAQSAIGQTPSQSPRNNIVGTWRGTSICLVHPSACHDEVVVYRITPMKAADRVSVDARKIVRGKEEEMGVLNCRLASEHSALTCAMPNGVWYFRLRKDSLVGELRLPDNTKFRDVRTVRER